MFSSARIGWPAATWPTSGRPLGLKTDVRASAALSSISMARGLDGSRRSSPAHRLADVAHRGRIAVARGVLPNEVVDLLLALREFFSDVDHDGARDS